MGEYKDDVGVSNNENIDIKNHPHKISVNGEQKTDHVLVDMESSSTQEDDTNLTNNTSREDDDLANESTITQPSIQDDDDDSINATVVNTNTNKRSNQLEYIQRVVLRALWKHPQSWPFREPVDSVKDNAQDYYTIIKNPMDLGTIRSKLLNGLYENAEESIEDFRLIFKNCYTYNSEGLMIRNMCESLEAFFNEKINNIPSLSYDDDMNEKETSQNETIKNGSVVSKKRSKDGGGSSKTPSKKKKLASTSTPSTTHNKSTQKICVSKTPEKKIVISEHTPSRRDSRKQPISTNGAKTQQALSQTRHLSFNFLAHTGSIPATSTSASLKYCLSMVRELCSKKHADYAWPFYGPVDAQSLNLTDYDNVIHYPMDLKSISKNLESGQYLTAFEYITDLRRMVTNSCRYNPPEHAVSQAGQRLIVAIELLIAKAPPEVYDFLVVAPCSIIIPKIDALPEATAGVVSMCKQQSRAANNNTTTTHKKTPSTTSVKSKAKKEYVSDEDYDDDFVDPLTSKEQHGAGFVCAEMNHAEPMTYEEKRKLSLEINRMPTEKLGDIIAFLSELESDIFKEKNQSEVEIDFDNMKPETLRSLEKYVKYLNKPQKSRKKKPTTSMSSINQSSNTYNTPAKLAPSITNISNPLTSTLKKPSHSITPASSKYQVVSSLALSEESDVDDDSYSEKTHTRQNSIENISRKSSSIPNAHSNISVPKSFSSSTSNLSTCMTKKPTAINPITNINTNTNKSGGGGVANKLTFDTVDDSLLPSSMLDICKKPEISSSDLINEAKAAVKQQKLANLHSATVSTNLSTNLSANLSANLPANLPANLCGSISRSVSTSLSGDDVDNIPQVTPKAASHVNSPMESPSMLNVGSGGINKHHAVSILTSSTSTVNQGPTTKPEIRGDTDAPRAPTSLEERERMKQEERQRRLAVASSSHPSKL